MKVEYKLVFLTLLARLGIGILFVSVLLSFFAWDAPAEYIVALVGMLVTGSGLALSLLHVGRPTRVVNVFANKDSMMSWEALLSPPLMIAMFALVVVSYLYPESGWLWLVRAFVLALGIAFIYVSGKVYYLRARPSWTTSLLLYEYFVSALCFGLLGYATIMVVTGTLDTVVFQMMAYALLALLVAEGIITYAFRSRAIHSTVTAAKALENPTNQRLYVLFVLVGLVLPIILAVVAIIGVNVNVIVPVTLLVYLLGAVWWRALFFRSATLIKITPDILI